ncbi:MAG: hypothetical protein KatS3mg035_2240 [Bacteroidia bacterium]|nr:MAG: hypothetical protein KatS3mg035_2240 [Bacteroidia bacterium]
MSLPIPVNISQSKNTTKTSIYPLGKKHYESTDWLGNVRVTYTDKKSWQQNKFALNVSSSQDYYPFGSVMEGRNLEIINYRFGFQGQEGDDEVFGTNNLWAYKYRLHDARLGRFFSVDPLLKNYPSSRSYVFANNNPIRYNEFDGLGPEDRVKKAKNFVGTKYSQKQGLNTGTELRTGNSEKALEYLDCSELVCRVLAYDNITPKVELWNTSILVNKLNDNTKFHRSDKPKVGDIFLWYSDNGGHTGVVTGVNDDGTIEITHAKGEKYGTITEIKPINYFTSHPGWQGFYRPIWEETESNSSEDLNFRSFKNLTNEELFNKAYNISLRISSAKNWANVRANIQEALGNIDRANEIRAASEFKINRLQQKLNRLISEIEQRGLKFENNENNENISTNE